MDTKDIAVTPSAAYQDVKTLMMSDTDHSDITSILNGVLMTNDTDQVIMYKNTGKGSAPAGDGRKLDIGQSVTIPILDTRRCYMKSIGVIGSGSVIITGEQQ
jgi:hypothetical protein